MCNGATRSKRYIAPGVCRSDSNTGGFEMATCFDNSAQLKRFSDENCMNEIEIEEEYEQNCTFYRSFLGDVKAYAQVMFWICFQYILLTI